MTIDHVYVAFVVIFLNFLKKSLVSTLNLVPSAAAFRDITQHALRDIPKNGYKGHYVKEDPHRPRTYKCLEAGPSPTA